MSNELISILVLIGIFVLGTTLPLNMGVLGIVAAFVLGAALGVSEDDIVAGFPGDLFVILVGVTYLFAIASNNGTVNWLIHAAVRAVGGRAAAIPWVFFFVTAILTASGAVVPGAVAIIAPIGLGFAVAYGINPVLMGLMIINGATAGGFSPISVFGSIVNGVVEREALAEDAMLLFLSSFLFNFALAVVTFFLFGGPKLLRKRVTTADGDESAGRFERRKEEEAAASGGRPPMAGGSAATFDADEMPQLDRDKIFTLIGIATLIVVVLLLEVNVGFVALSIALVLVTDLAAGDQGRGVEGRLADRPADLRHRDVRDPAREHRHHRVARQPGHEDRLGAARGADHLLHRRRGLRVRFDHGHPRAH